MRAKTRFYLSFVLVLIFVTCTSYMILEFPWAAEHVEGENDQESSFRRSDIMDRSSEALIKTLSGKYKPHKNCNSGVSPWKLAESWVSPRHVFPEYASENELGCILKALATAEITHADVGYKGTQLKMTVTLQGGQRAVFKPKWYDEDYVMVGPPYAGKDRHHAEIAAFHLGRILNMRKVPIVVRRRINLRKEILPVAHKTLADTFYQSSDGKDLCFYGKCYYCKGRETGVCASGDVMDGALVLWLPDAYALSKPLRHPWARTYKDGVQAKWEYMDSYCSLVRTQPPYNSGPRLLDLIDIAVFDYLAGNADRHRYETFEHSPDSMVVMLDNGKSFGTPYHSETSILAPLYQCCTIRQTTVEQLSRLTGGVLGQVLREVLLHVDPLLDADKQWQVPLLPDLHFNVIDKRLQYVLGVVDTCLEKRRRDGSGGKVLIDDAFM